MPAKQQSASAEETTEVPNKISDEVLSIRWSNPAFRVPGPSGGRSGSSRSAIAEGRQKEDVSMSVEFVSRTAWRRFSLIKKFNVNRHAASRFL